jgi:hypothetical protein
MEKRVHGPLTPALPAALFGAAGAAGVWGWLAQDDRVQLLLAAATLAVTGFLAIYWAYRVRSARRWNATLDAYAEQDSARNLARRKDRTIYSRRNPHARTQPQNR